MARRLEITLSDELWERLEAARCHPSGAFIPRAAFVKRALESALGRESMVAVVPGSVSSQAPTHPASDLELQATRNIAEQAGVVIFKCRACGFTARSSKARCPHHGGVLIPM